MHKIIGQTTLHFKSHISLVKTQVFTIMDSKSSSINFLANSGPCDQESPFMKYSTTSRNQFHKYKYFSLIVK